MYTLKMWHNKGPKMGQLEKIGDYASLRRAQNARVHFGWIKVRGVPEWLANTTDGCLSITLKD